MTRLGKLMRMFVRETTDPLRAPAGETEPLLADHEGPVQYAPELDGEPDPGEVVWAISARGT